MYRRFYPAALILLAGCGGGSDDTAVSATPAPVSAPAPAPAPAPVAAPPAAPAPAPAPTPAAPPIAPPAPVPAPQPAPAPAPTVSGDFLRSVIAIWNTAQGGNPSAIGTAADGTRAYLDQRLLSDMSSCQWGAQSAGWAGVDLPGAGVGGSCVYTGTYLTLAADMGTLTRSEPFVIDFTARFPINQVIAEWRNGDDFAQLIVQSDDDPAVLRGCWHLRAPALKRLACVRIDPDRLGLALGVYIVDDSLAYGVRTWR